MTRLTTVQLQDCTVEILLQAIFHGEFTGKACRITYQDGSKCYAVYKGNLQDGLGKAEKIFATYEDMRKWWNNIMQYNHYYSMPGEEGKAYLPMEEVE